MAQRRKPRKTKSWSFCAVCTGNTRWRRFSASRVIETGSVKHYDPEKQQIPAEWLALDESERLRLVELHHRAARIRLPNARLHAAIHAVVENQLALDHQPIVRNSLNRLLSEGLSRHEALHAIGSVVAAHVYDILKSSSVPDHSHVAYYSELETLTAEKWRTG